MRTPSGLAPRNLFLLQPLPALNRSEDPPSQSSRAWARHSTFHGGGKKILHPAEADRKKAQSGDVGVECRCICSFKVGGHASMSRGCGFCLFPSFEQLQLPMNLQEGLKTHLARPSSDCARTARRIARSCWPREQKPRALSG